MFARLSLGEIRNQVPHITYGDFQAPESSTFSNMYFYILWRVNCHTPGYKMDRQQASTNEFEYIMVFIIGAMLHRSSLPSLSQELKDITDGKATTNLGSVLLHLRYGPL